MNDVADENGKVEPRVKLIRSESIGNFMWDFKCDGYGTSVNNKAGSNNIIDSQLIMILNPITRIPEGYSVDENNYLLDAKYHKIMRSPGSYYNRTRGYKYENTTSCYSSISSFTSVDFSNIGLTSESRNMISAVVWKMGGVNAIGDVSEIYVNERSSYKYERNPIEWTGEVGLMYSSDYIYSTSADDKDCYFGIYDWKDYCKINSWLYTAGKSQWLMTPRYTSNYQVMKIYSEGSVSLSEIKNLAYVRPVVYLNTNLKITSGTGTSSDPFQLKI